MPEWCVEHALSYALLAALDTRQSALSERSETLSPAVFAQQKQDLEDERARVIAEDLVAYAAHLGHANLLVKRLSLAWQDPLVALPLSVFFALVVLGGPLVWMVITREGQSLAIEWPAKSMGLAWSYQVEQHRRDRTQILADHAAARQEIERLLAPYYSRGPVETSAPHYLDPPFNQVRRQLVPPRHRRRKLLDLFEALED